MQSISKSERPYSVVPHDPNWKNRFQEEKHVLESIFGDDALLIEHVGSTSVEGMWAKPQIDILVVVDDLENVRKQHEKFTAAGYTAHGDYSDIGEEYFTRDNASGTREVSIHVMPPHAEQVRSDLYFRDYLRTHPDERALYSKIKRAAYEGGMTDRVEYAKKKRENGMNALLERARVWYENEPYDLGIGK